MAATVNRCLTGNGREGWVLHLLSRADGLADLLPRSTAVDARVRGCHDVCFGLSAVTAIEQRAAAEETDPETFRDEVLAGVRRTAEWKKAHPTKVRLFYYDAYPVWRLERIDDDLIFAHSYQAGSRGTLGAIPAREVAVASPGGARRCRVPTDARSGIDSLREK